MLQESREVRVFISSTFADMREERRYLNTKVFPELRKICQQRDVVFTEVDLQWGIEDEDAKQGAAVEICLEEINRCQPYFIGILGERYGWSPQDDQLRVRQDNVEYSEEDEKKIIPVRSDVLKEGVRRWVEKGESVTAMEIKHGVLDSDAYKAGSTKEEDANEQAKCSYFYFRNKKYTQELLAQAKEGEGSEVKNKDFIEDNFNKQIKLKKLKERIRSKEKPWHVHETFALEGKKASNQGYTNMEEFGQQVYKDLKKAINDKFPEDEGLTHIDKERNFHAAFARSRLQSYIPDRQMFHRLFELLESSDAPLMVTGEMGSGKSALLANFAVEWVKMNHANQGYTIEHYVGSGGESDTVGVLRRIMNEVKAEDKLEQEVPVQADEVYFEFSRWVLSTTKDKPILIMLDGINQLDGELRRFLHAIPKHTRHVQFILSALEGEALDIAKEKGWTIEEVKGLENGGRDLISSYLEQVSKKLPSSLISMLSNSKMANNPLFLRVVLDELRVDASHDTLQEMLEGYLKADRLDELFEMVLERCEKVYAKSNVPFVMSLIWASRNGLSEHELREICHKKSEYYVQPLHLSELIFGLGSYFSDREGLYGFMHDGLQKAVKKKYLHGEEGKEKLYKVRNLIVDYFEHKDISKRQVDELPWQYKVLGKKTSLRQYICEPSVFSEFTHRQEWEYELFGYNWWAKPDKGYMVGSYTKVYEPLNSKEKLRLAESLAYYYSFSAMYQESAVIFDLLCASMVDIDSIEAVGKQISWRKDQAYALRRCGMFQEAVNTIDKSLRLIDLCPDQITSSGDVWFERGSIYVEYYDYSKVPQFLLQGEKCIEKSCQEHVKNGTNQSASLLILGTIYTRLGKLEKAEESIRKVISLREELSSSDDYSLATPMYNLGGVLRLQATKLYNESKFRDALGYYKRAFKIRSRLYPIDSGIVERSRLEVLETLVATAELLSGDKPAVQGIFIEAYEFYVFPLVKYGKEIELGMYENIFNRLVKLSSSCYQIGCLALAASILKNILNLDKDNTNRISVDYIRDVKDIYTTIKGEIQSLEVDEETLKNQIQLKLSAGEDVCSELSSLKYILEKLERGYEFEEYTKKVL